MKKGEDKMKSFTTTITPKNVNEVATKLKSLNLIVVQTGRMYISAHRVEYNKESKCFDLYDDANFIGSIYADEFDDNTKYTFIHR